MERMDLASHPVPFGDDAPSGANLEYDPLFVALELAAQPKEERQVGDQVIEAEEPDWKDVARKAQAVLERSHDLRAAALLAHARLRLEGLPGFAEAMGYMSRCLDGFWDSCHPQLDPEDDDDPTMRVNAVRALTDTAGVMRALAVTPLTASRTFGRFALRDIAVARGETPAPADMTEPPDLRAIMAAFQDTDPETLRATRAAAAAALTAADAVSAAFDARTPGLGPDLGPLQAALRKIVRNLAEAVGEDAPATEDLAAAAEPGAAPPRGGAPGAVENRADVIAALDRIIAYYGKNEPTSPVPLLLARAKRLVNADFLTIIRELAPSGLDNVTMIAGVESD
jgi:type VI secretion system protein ImpA